MTPKEQILMNLQSQKKKNSKKTHVNCHLQISSNWSRPQCVTTFIIYCELKIIDRWSIRIGDLLGYPPTWLQKFKRPKWPWHLTYWPGNGIWHIVIPWVVFVSHMNIIHETGNEPQSRQSMPDRQTEGVKPTSLCKGIKTKRICIYIQWNPSGMPAMSH